MEENEEWLSAGFTVKKIQSGIHQLSISISFFFLGMVYTLPTPEFLCYDLVSHGYPTLVWPMWYVP